MNARHRAPRLQRLLLAWVLLPQLVVWAAGGAAAYFLTARYVNSTLDQDLLRASRSLARQLKPIGNGLLIDFPRAAQAILEADPDDRYYYMVSLPPGQFVLGNLQLAAPPPDIAERLQPGQPVLYDGTMPMAPDGAPQPVRVVALYVTLDGEPNQAPALALVQVARSRLVRQQLAHRILVDMLLPLSALVAAMTVVVWVGIRRGLAPLKRLTEQVTGRAPSDLTPLRLEAAPEELQALARALNALLSEIQHHVQAQQRFLADAAHQLRTPLAGLQSQAELALSSAPETALEHRQRLQRLLASATRASHLVNQLLALARLEPRQRLPLDETLELSAWAQDIVAMWVPRAMRLGIDLGWTDQPSRPLRVRAHALLLREALDNVLDNALRYVGSGGEVTVGTRRREDGHAVLWVRDNGPGIAPEHRARVFERFYRAASDDQGCGLGLAIVRDILRLHGGDALLHHPDSGGLEVQLVLPLLSA
jgi:two-component system sensor histidine kinase TctE